ncbi:hypothetical protein [Undibacterium terreum]|uniref:Uncharacterized protein n=1 Tax=Undibacterium terreum TaxID=1224302 RepID=A0A916UH99_9BURK|nr:hypothetical protein [Undibacterium terreum]GGC72324.1 hypothetical protein GCM10011396_19310 [Undibacterium terreum]
MKTNFPALIEAQSLVKIGDIVGAESALATMAETEGDHALVAALDEFPAKDLLAIIREYDTSKESLVNLLVTPEQFAKAVVLEKRYGDLSHEQLRGMINSVIFREGADPAEFLYEIGELDGGYDALVDYLSERTKRVEHFYRYGTFDLFEYGDEVKTQAIDDDLMNLSGDTDASLSPQDMANVIDHDWMEVTYILRFQLPELFREVLLKLRTRYQNSAQALEDAEAEMLAKDEDDEDAPKNEKEDKGDEEESAL